MALELLTKPSLLFLDEPTSGLDPGMDRSVMHLLRGLADDGRTVIVVTHSVAEPGRLRPPAGTRSRGPDRLLRPAEDALAFFGFEQWPEAFEAFEQDQDRDWAARYRRLDPSTGSTSPATTQPRVPRRTPPRSSAPTRPGAELVRPAGTLVRRYAAALVADRTFLAIMIALPFVMGAMARALAGNRLTDIDGA